VTRAPSSRSGPSGSAPSGSAPSGSAPSGSAPSGSAPSGSAPSGSAPSGSAPSGSASSHPGPSRSASSGDPPSLRLFVALELPPAAHSALVAFHDAAADPAVWRPVAVEALHLTLAFLGRRPAGDVAVVERILREAAGPAPRLALGGAVLLPPRRPRVLCAALDDPDGTLGELQARVSDGLATAGVYVPEKRPYRAHATVARLRPRERAPRTVSAAPEPLEFHGGPLTLFESRLHPRGARYEPLSRVSLR